MLMERNSPNRQQAKALIQHDLLVERRIGPPKRPYSREGHLDGLSILPPCWRRQLSAVLGLALLITTLWGYCTKAATPLWRSFHAQKSRELVIPAPASFL